MADLVPNGDYATFLRGLKETIRASQLRAMVTVNAELVRLYWGIGKELAERQKAAKWGSKVLERLSEDLMAEFPGQKGFSLRNLKYMKALAEAWPDGQIGQPPIAQLSWSNQIALLEKLDDPQERLWYAHRAVDEGWSRNVLAMQIDSKLIKRQGRAQTNFTERMPQIDSDLAQEMLKDPMNFSFLGMEEFRHELHLENALIADLGKFLVELGRGFAFVGKQVRLEVGGREFFIDLLFYHLKLHRYVVIDLKMGEFDPRDEGQLRFYVNVVDEQRRDPLKDEPTIGILLCPSKNSKVVEVALRGSPVPMAVTTYELGRDEKASLAIEEMENFLSHSEEAAASIDVSSSEERVALPAGGRAAGPTDIRTSKTKVVNEHLMNVRKPPHEP